ncbi:MAG: type II toxin-antitoxin system RelE/ParE family toxin [Spirochaetales bacterium]|nr:type II toxin-antitoxin system RelE/ParE family toxin [Spirochaetales bacterium]
MEFSATAIKQLKKIDKKQQKEILDYLDFDVSPLIDPRSRGKALSGDLKNLWRYRVGDYRVICQILDADLIVFAIAIGHRKNIYKK